MKPFLIIGLGRFLKENSVETVFAVFSEFYHSISYKYQKSSELVLIDKDYHHNLNKDLSTKYNIEGNTRLLPLSDQKQVEAMYGQGSLLLLPRKVNCSSIIKEAFQYGLPVLGYAHSSHDNLLDASTGLKVFYESEAQAIRSMADNIRLLKYDPEAVKLLKKGASKKYQAEYKWKRKQQSGG
jgi:glycosyltransferase involved in cell wall biosynthesis